MEKKRVDEKLNLKNNASTLDKGILLFSDSVYDIIQEDFDLKKLQYYINLIHPIISWIEHELLDSIDFKNTEIISFDRTIGINGKVFDNLIFLKNENIYVNTTVLSLFKLNACPNLWLSLLLWILHELGHLIERKLNPKFINHALMQRSAVRGYYDFMREKHADILAWFLYQNLEWQFYIPEWKSFISSNFFYSLWHKGKRVEEVKWEIVPWFLSSANVFQLHWYPVERRQNFNKGYNSSSNDIQTVITYNPFNQGSIDTFKEVDSWLRE